MCHMSGVTCHMSHVRCHVSGDTCQVPCLFFLTKWWSLSMAGLLSTGPIPSSFPQRKGNSKTAWWRESKFCAISSIFVAYFGLISIYKIFVLIFQVTEENVVGHLQMFCALVVFRRINWPKNSYLRNNKNKHRHAYITTYRPNQSGMWKSNLKSTVEEEITKILNRLGAYSFSWSTRRLPQS